MPVDDDMALIGGRETFGFPKKIAEQISLKRDGDHVVGRVVRKEREILRIECELDDAPPDASLGGLAERTQDLEGNPCYAFTSFLFKYFPSPDNLGFDYRPRLIRQVTLFRPRAGLQCGTGQVEVTSSRADPLGEVPVREVLTCTYGEWDNSMLPGRVVAQPLNVMRFLPHAFFKNDFISLYLAEPPPSLGLFERLQLKLKLRRY
jgi:acetoacetate decarboxylase